MRSKSRGTGSARQFRDRSPGRAKGADVTHVDRAASRQLAQEEAEPAAKRQKLAEASKKEAGDARAGCHPCPVSLLLLSGFGKIRRSTSAAFDAAGAVLFISSIVPFKLTGAFLKLGISLV